MEERITNPRMKSGSPRIGTEMIHAISSNVARFVTIDLFVKALRALVVEEQQPKLVAQRKLSETPAFPYSRPNFFAASKTIYNLCACDNDFEQRFARFLLNGEGASSPSAAVYLLATR